jgi:hypothetical protein
MLPETEQKIKELKAQGYEVVLYTSEKNFPLTGRYTAYYASISKDDNVVGEQYSRESYDEALKFL